MKITLTFLFLSISLFVLGQDFQKEKEIMKIVQDQDSLQRSVFLDTSTIKNMRLSNITNWRQIWTDINDSIKSIHQFYDIRLKFKSDSAALAFHHTFLPENSEYGPEIKKHKIKVEGIQELYVFNTDPKMSKAFLEPYGFQALCFIFVVDNYFVKFYITCLKEYKPTYFTSYIEDAMKKIKKSNKGG